MSEVHDRHYSLGGGAGIHSRCATCRFRDWPFCSLLLDETGEAHPALDKTTLQAKARQTVLRPDDRGDRVLVVRRGWAAVQEFLADGRRQILSVLLPGDTLPFSVAAGDRTSFSVMALSPLEYCLFERSALRSHSRTSSAAMETLTGLSFRQIGMLHRRLVDLGRRSAEQRIASFILDVMDRLVPLGEVREGQFPFFVRQQDMADALGLTQVHVSRVVTRLRRNGFIEAVKGGLRVADVSGLRRLAGGA